MPFVTARGHTPGARLDAADLRSRLVKPKQLELF
jgi:hypothetical protein